MRILHLLISLALFFSFTAPVYAGGAQVTDEQAGVSQSGNLSERCQQVLLRTSAQNTINSASGAFSGTDLSLEPDTSGDIIVLLSEGISRDGVEYSCGEIVSCLRQRYTGANSEGLVVATVRRDYPSCIISGSDGIDLLSNYASRVYQWIAGIVGSVCILVIIISGIQVSVGGLSQEEVSNAKDRVVRALVGLVVLFLSAFILYTINPIFFT